jgi:hypothetical protein
VSASIAFCSVGVTFSANLAVDGIMESVFTDVSGATVNYSHRTGRKYSLVEAQVLGMLYNWHVLQPSILTVVVIGCATFTFAGFVTHYFSSASRESTCFPVSWVLARTRPSRSRLENDCLPSRKRRSQVSGRSALSCNWAKLEAGLVKDFDAPLYLRDRQPCRSALL